MEDVKGADFVMLHLHGRVGGEPLSPDNFNLPLQVEMLSCACELLCDRKSDGATVTYTVEPGSVKNIFKVDKRVAVSVATAVALAAAEPCGNLNKLDAQAAKVFEKFQKFVKKNNWVLDISTTASEASLSMSPDTAYATTDDVWCDTEMFYFGRIISAGGAKNPKINMETRHGRLSISVEEGMLHDMPNPLYREYGVQVIARQNVMTGEIDQSHDMRLVSFIDYKPGFDEGYLSMLQDKAAKSWGGVDVDKYINDIRGTYD